MSLFLRLVGLGGHASLQAKSYRLPKAKATVVAISETKVSVEINVTLRLMEDHLDQARTHFDCVGHMKAEVEADVISALHEWASHRNCVAMCRHSREQLYLLRDYITKRPYGIILEGFTLHTRCHVGHTHCENPSVTI